MLPCPFGQAGTGLPTAGRLSVTVLSLCPDSYRESKGQHDNWYTLAVDSYHTKNWSDKFKLWFMPTGWRPADVAEKYPLFTIQKMSDLNKYNPGYSKWFTRLSFIHIHMLFLLVCFLFFRFGEISKTEALVNGIFLLLATFGFTSLLDKKQYGIISLLMVSTSIVIFALVKGDWFGLNTFVPFGSVLVATYFIAVAFTAGWFYKTELSLADSNNILSYGLVSAPTETNR